MRVSSLSENDVLPNTCQDIADIMEDRLHASMGPRSIERGSTGSSSDELYAACENAGVWPQVDASGVGHCWRDVDVDAGELNYDALTALASSPLGTEIVVGGVPMRLRTCEFA